MSARRTLAIVIVGLVRALVHGLVCYQCLDGEYSQLCNKTATLTRCQRSEEVCFTQVTAEGAGVFTTSYKTCMDRKQCEALELTNSAACGRGEIGRSCSWCCSSDRCNYDRLVYRRHVPTQPAATPRPPEVTSQCVPVATGNCTRLDLERCTSDYKRYVDQYLNGEEDFNFCKRFPDVISCLTASLETCYHPDYISGVTSLLEEAVTSLKAQCPDGACDEYSATLCTYNFLMKVVHFVLSPGGSCELIMREFQAHKQCTELSMSACGSELTLRYSSASSFLYESTVSLCTVLPSTIHPPKAATKAGATTTYGYTTSGSWLPRTTSRPSGLTGSSTTPTTSWTTSTLPPPTESPDCHVDMATKCINDLALEISKQTGELTPDYSKICDDLLPSSIRCARNMTTYCSHFVQNRIEVLIEYLGNLLGGACQTTTVPPSVCDTKTARSCLVTLLTLTYNKDIEQACRYRKNATECIKVNTEGCTEEEKNSLNKVLTETLSSLEDKCTDYVQCSNDGVIVLIEGGESKQVTFTFNQSPADICKGTPGCEIMVDFVLEEVPSPRCANGMPISQVLLGNIDDDSFDAAPSYSRRITLENWQQTHTVTLTGRIDLVQDGDQKRNLSIVLRKTIYDVVVETRTVCVFEILVVDNDTSAVCKSLNDPHVHTFDNVYYNNHYQGIFKLYQHRIYPYEVQVAYKRCTITRSPTCNCAVYVRAGDTVFVADKCQPVNRRRCRRSCPLRLRSALFYPDDVTPGMRIYSSRGGRIFDVVLPHGTRIRINDAETTLINVYIYPSPYDWKMTTGLCGLYDGNEQTDLIDASGTFYDVTALQSLKLRMPIALTKSWRVSPDQYIHDGYKRDAFITPTLCLNSRNPDQSGGATTKICDPGLLVETCNTDLGVDITRSLPRKDSAKYGRPNGRRKRSADDSFLPEFDEDYNPLDEEDSGSSSWNLTAARMYCWDFLQSDPVIQSCLSVPNVDMHFEMDICVDDILATGETIWAPRARESVVEKCKHELQTNPAYLDTAIGRRLSESVLGRICPNDCSGHGLCIQGQCECSAPYIGHDCSIAAGGAISGLSLDGGGLCDVARAECTKVFVYADHVVDTGKAACQFTRAKVTDLDRGDDDSQSLVRDATLLTYQQLSCPLPVRGQSYKVKVTLDGTSFSEELLFVPYNSNCVNCELSTEGNITCTRHDDSCIVDGVCYAAGSVHSTDPCLLCDPGQSLSKLSRSSSFSCLPGGIAIVTVVCVVVVLAIIAICLCVMFRRRKYRTKKTLSDDKATTEAMCTMSEREASVADDKAVISL